jgi:hypothetical protein
MADDTAEEKDFRERYTLELHKKKVKHYASPHFGSDELLDEMRKITRQEMITPGRRGEQIKHEEIIKEIIRRLSLDEEHSEKKGEER